MIAERLSSVRRVPAVAPVRRPEYNRSRAGRTRYRSGLPSNRRLVCEWALPIHADDQSVRLWAHGKRLQDLDGPVVAEEAVAQDLEVVEEGRRHGELEALHPGLVDR